MYYQTKTGTPCAYITKDRKRLKQFGHNVYLNNGDEFELELFNPSTTTVLAKIKLDGSYISGGGIVLKPGQRVYLERYLDDPRKFKFETYEVDGTSNEVLDAIAGNGDVVIDFFNEYKQPVWYNNNIILGGSFGGPTYYNSTVSGGYAHTTLSNNVSFTSSNTGGINFNTTSMSNTFDGPNLRSETSRLKKSKGNSRSEVTMDMLSMDSIETGRVEKGGVSDQSFKTVDKTFNHYTCATSIWKILPVSQKVFEKQDLKVYCTNCGKKRKKDSDKFCSSCGNKF
jgi:hypothetical protein